MKKFEPSSGFTPAKNLQFIVQLNQPKPKNLV